MTERKKLPSIDRLNELFFYVGGHLYWKKKSHPKANKTNFRKPVGTTDARGYLTVQFDKNIYLIHRLIYKMFTGKEPDYLDHINGISNDNRIENLKEVTQSENTFKGCIRKNNTSGFIGISYSKITKKWCAYIGQNGKSKHLGYFDNIKDAIEIRKIEENKKLKNYVL